MKRAAIALALLVTTACSNGQSKSEAFCADLRSGLTPMQILANDYKPETAADRAYGFAAASCPDQLKSNDTLRTYLQGWGINPDA